MDDKGNLDEFGRALLMHLEYINRIQVFLCPLKEQTFSLFFKQELLYMKHPRGDKFSFQTFKDRLYTRSLHMNLINVQEHTDSFLDFMSAINERNEDVVPLSHLISVLFSLS